MFRTITTRYTMLADVYSQSRIDPETGDRLPPEQNESGQIIRDWDEDDDNPEIMDKLTITCMARPVMGGGIRVVGSTERFGDEYEDVEWVKLQTQHQLSKRDRIGKIRDKKTGRVIWTDDQGDPHIFEVLGANPIMDPFGRVVEYDLLLQKVQDE